MTRIEMVKHIRERLKSEYGMENPPDKETIDAILKIEEDEVYTLIALCEQYKYVWGTIYGAESPPIEIAGFMKYHQTIVDNHGWSQYKKGAPKVKWSPAALICDSYPPETYFNKKEHRYTTAARKYRKAAGLPEIPEYEDLDEEKIVELCKKADAIEFSKLPKKAQKKKLKDAKNNKQKVDAVHRVWEQTGYVALGATSEDYTGKNEDRVDRYLAVSLENNKDLPIEEQLERMRQVKDFATYLHLIDQHPEIDDYINQYLEEVKRQGKQELPRTPIYNEFNFLKVRYQDTSDPWAYDPHKARQEQLEKAAEAEKEAREELVQYMMELKGINGEKDIKDFEEELIKRPDN